jgi:hypothetical protein
VVDTHAEKIEIERHAARNKAWSARPPRSLLERNDAGLLQLLEGPGKIRLCTALSPKKRLQKLAERKLDRRFSRSETKAVQLACGKQVEIGSAGLAAAMPPT